MVSLGHNVLITMGFNLLNRQVSYFKALWNLKSTIFFVLRIFQLPLNVACILVALLLSYLLKFQNDIDIFPPNLICELKIDSETGPWLLA